MLISCLSFIHTVENAENVTFFPLMEDSKNYLYFFWENYILNPSLVMLTN
jgi:hypothetical protein